jgi:hypothetical protein
MRRALGFAWTLPNTLLGLAAGVLTFQRPRVACGALVFDREARGLTWAMSRLDRTAMTLGVVIVSAAPLTDELMAHEQAHIRQYCAWGPLFIPAYLALTIPYGYWRNPFEVSARRAADDHAAGRSVGALKRAGGRSSPGRPAARG